MAEPMDLMTELEWRGLVYQVSDRDGLAKALAAGPVTVYGGFDPTADSLHIGNLVLILTLRRFQLAGHRPIALVGGATGLIGDPSGRTTERALNAAETVAAWSAKIRRQLERLLDFDRPGNPAAIVNNYDWIGDLGVIAFLRDVGKHFSLNYMLAKESVATRLERGISFTEFSYMLLQAYDFLNLFRTEGCRLQIGGSDQWGNITAGLELIRRVEGADAFGLTHPLVTKADGTKFGKTADGAVWLDREKTSPYQFYQFWMNTDDRDVVRFLKYFTFLSPAEIEELAREVEVHPERRAAQRALAREVTRLVHGDEDAARAERISQALFSGDVRQLSAEELALGFADVPSVTLARGQARPLLDVLVEVGACSSKRQAREDIRNGAVSVNGVRVADLEAQVTEADALAGEYVVLRRGKRNYFLVRFAK
ncbi:tyrosine--tRNA ligase 1 [Alicyclobacillus cellulosilyticus]|uniref:Tyrosine--tRNA ligase n=2 Tax=Alicyclobacillus cellulosilyticus TaxID=1003997 RepID=A0A917NK06_9BACL|nr:tyrosine--tRNA ligase 1 [Alicyclobacillus cellulosilyticus]